MGLLCGVGGGRFDPDGSVTRAQIVTFLSPVEWFVGWSGWWGWVGF